MDDKGGSEGCLLYDPNPPIRQTVSPLLCPGLLLPVQLPTIRRSLGLYQDPEALLRELGVRLVRQHPDYGRVGGTGEGPHPQSDVLAGEPGVHSTPSENPCPADRVPWNANEFLPGQKIKKLQQS